MQVVDRAQLHIKQIADLTVAVRIVADPVELEIHISQTGCGGFTAKFLALGEFDAIGSGLNTVVSNLARVLDRFDEMRRNRWLATRELHRHLPARLD